MFTPAITYAESIDLQNSQMVATDKSIETINGYNNVYRRFGRFLTEHHSGPSMPITTLSKRHANGFMRWLATTKFIPGHPSTKPAKHLAASTRAIYPIALSALWSTLIDDEYTTTNIWRGIKKPHSDTESAPIVLTLTESRALIKACTVLSPKRRLPRPTGIRDAAIASLMIDCALRASELIQLPLTDLNLQDHTIRIHQSRSKSRNSRTITFGHQTYRLLYRWIKQSEQFEPRPETVFFNIANNTGAPIGREALNKQIKALASIAKIKKPVTTHSLRHTGITLRASTMSPFQLRQFAGHTNITTTLRYVHLAQLTAAPVTSPLD